ncbi:hypothetical protein Mal4_38460 [Maioricimonas rarisocia]|uniref:SGNH hydrolase-type esterase domain-containing protein n=1 Tax=Maioricimonas rarisocia TaxID=2528026 RepID=A0A517ZAQ1_9PLAN|nr:SGNH/GDSL hydrolase family protein [Maioricimonas rarisocia]QDU39501.1 hypothetical protein Mal4_38460 [Maioricimonas rarisocia]
MEENLLLFLFAAAPVLLLALVALFFLRLLPRIRHRRVLSLVTGNLLVTLLLLSLVVFLGEFYVRYRYDATDSFGLTRTTADWFERHWQTNSDGFRDSQDYYPQIAPGHRRISLIGDSFTAGHGVPDVEDRFANRLRAAHPDLEVHALARPGWDTGTHLDVVQFLGNSGYEWDLVVLVYCLNDISDIIPEWQRVLHRIYKAPKPGFLVRNSYLFNLLDARLRAAREPQISDYYSMVRTGYEGRQWDVQQQRLAMIEQSVRETGGRLLVVTFPFLHALDGDYEYADVHEQLNRFWKSRDVPHLDLLQTFESMTADELIVSRYDVHPNERAHALAAEAIGEFVMRHLNASESAKQ